MKKFICIILAIFLITMTFACDKKEVDKYADYEELLSDLELNNGMKMTAASKENPRFEWLKTLDYGGIATAKEPEWRLFQWASYKHPLDDVAEKKEGNKFTYESESTKVVIDRDKKDMAMGLTTSKEYVDEDGKHQPRIAEQHWPSIYFDQSIARMPSVGELDDLVMDIEFTILQMDNMMTEQEFNQNLHTSQFMWYLTIINKEKFHGVINDYLWFGAMYYDYRYPLTETSGQLDGGKDDATGKYIYNVGMKDYLTKPIEVGQKLRITISVLPQILSGIKDAQERGYLVGCVGDLLKVNFMNIGWEVPGTFDCEVNISDISLKAKFKE